MFFEEIELHRELTDFALQCRDLDLVVVDQRGFDLFTCKLSAIELCRRHLDEVGAQAVLRLRIAPTDRAASNLLAELRSTPPIRAS